MMAFLVQTPVAQRVAGVPALRRFGRWRHWMRPGYLEEIFVPNSSHRAD